MSRNHAFLLLAALASQIALGCGGEDDGRGQPDPPTREEYVAAVNSICSERSESVARAHEEINKPGDTKHLTSVASEVFVDPLQAEIDAIIEIPPPRGDEDQVDAIISQMQLAINHVDSNARLLRNSSARLLRRYKREVAAANRFARNYGLTACRL